MTGPDNRHPSAVDVEKRGGAEECVEKSEGRAHRAGSAPLRMSPATIHTLSGGFSRNGPSKGIARGVSHSPVSSTRSTAYE